MLTIGLSVTLSSCLKKQTASPIPVISFKDFKANKDTANLYINFIGKINVQYQMATDELFYEKKLIFIKLYNFFLH
jgi:hypothetical protein